MDYTKGPWNVSVFNEAGGEISDSVGHSLCIIGNVFGTIEENRANALLISAAPEMYEALKMVIASVPFADYRGDGELEEVARAVYNAITKAEGRNEE